MFGTAILFEYHSPVTTIIITKHHALQKIKINKKGKMNGMNSLSAKDKILITFGFDKKKN